MEQPPLALPDVPDEVLLTAVVDRLLARPAVDLPGPLALERTRVLLMQCERLRVAALDGVRDVDARELYALDGAGGTAGWLRRQRAGSRVAPVQLARRLAGRPAVQAALASGTLNVPTADRLCGLLAALPDSADETTVQVVLLEEVPALLAELAGGSAPDPDGTAAVLQACAAETGAPLADRLEPAWVLLAARLPAACVDRVLRHLTDALLPEEHLARWEFEQARTDLQLRELLDGYCDIRGLLDPETAAALRAELHARRTTPAPADAGGTPDSLLTAGQRRVLALRQLLRDASAAGGAGGAAADDGASAGDGDDGYDAPVAADGTDPVDEADDGDHSDHADHVDHADHSDHTEDDRVALPAADGSGVQLTLVSRPDRPLAGRTFPVLATVDAVLGRPGALPGRFGPRLSTSLPLDVLRRLGCGAALAAVVLDAHGTPIGASGTHRNATPRERRALLAQWGGQCATDGCPNPGVIPHHAEPWWLTHRTRLRDLVPYCDTCHHDLHEGHRTLRLRNGRWISPTGWCDPPQQQQAG